MILLTEAAALCPGYVRAAVRRGPRPFVLRRIDVALHRLSRTVLWYPGELLLGPRQIGPMVLVVLHGRRTLAGRIGPVQRRMAKRRGQRVGHDHDPDQRRGDGLRPHPVA